MSGKGPESMAPGVRVLGVEIDQLLQHEAAVLTTGVTGDLAARRPLRAIRKQRCPPCPIGVPRWRNPMPRKASGFPRVATLETGLCLIFLETEETSSSSSSLA
jgi:hypothetical protein